MKRLLAGCTLVALVVVLLTFNGGADSPVGDNVRRCIAVRPELLPIGGATVGPPVICAWASVGWVYYDESVCRETLDLFEESGVDKVARPENAEPEVCAAPTGSGGGGSNGGKGHASFNQDVGSGPGSCEWGDFLNLIAWDECTESFDHGDPHLHTAVQCHEVTTAVTNTLWAGLTVTAKSCPSVQAP